ncbi:DUF3325 domain-containing protein [Parahaliea mediterranea]|uniref:DUF3325 domain-containing protein n=1 Tax=Parahaliea mediterranea TaxID=651086 RepID=UPI000E2E6F34|nr:DUF3325 domain-containing protein [Parahaliea mediterranea]
MALDFVLALALSTLAFLHFAYASSSYYRALNGRARTPLAFWILQGVAWALLLASVLPCVRRWELEIGLTTWFGTITVAVLVVAVLVNYRWSLVALSWRLNPLAQLFKALPEAGEQGNIGRGRGVENRGVEVQERA